ncbi:ERC1 [Candida margitis]|uniref:ERC1 n=1 Tax=Candida margitis TaxID=1775924 RepID=UPI002227B710|nr:ERC1 [Candida margitis]KAI5970154.1 ERC1 [Candida margitis]
MSQPDRSHQFTHSSSKRRASVVYGSIGKGGLYIPSDFIGSSSNKTHHLQEDSLADENAPLLDVQGPQAALVEPTPNPFKNRRKSSTVARELLEQERELLHESHIPVDDLKSDDDVRDAFEDAVQNKQIEVTTPLIELKTLISSSIPSVVTFLLQCSLSTVSVFCVGHIGATELAAVSMGAMTANITGYATIQGIATALDTLCPQAFGARKYTMVGEYFQKCTALIVVVMLPVLIAWVFFGYDLICLIVPDKETAKFAAVYLQYVSFGIPGYISFECGKRFLQAQGIYNIGAYVLLVAAPSNLFMNWYLVKKIGYVGAPISVAINYWLMAIGLYVLTVFYIKAEDTPNGFHPLRCWGGLDIKKAFKGWGRLISLAIPGLVMLEAEFLAFEILTLLASYIDTKSLAAQSIGTTMASLTYQVPFAIGIASSSRIANFLGAGLAESAKVTTKVSLSFGLVISLLNFLALYCFQRPIAEAFTKDQDVINIVLNVMWLIALMQISDAMNANSAGCLRGQGQTKIGGIVNLVSYYVVGLPLSIYLSFYSPWKGSLNGLWIGSTVALTIIGVVQSYYALAANFNHLCEEARKRTSAQEV